MLTNGGHLTCIDISDYWIAKARKILDKYSNVECRSGDFRELDIPDSSFDVISAIHVVHDIAPAERQVIVQALSQKLRTSGVFFVREPVKESHGISVIEIRDLFSGAGLREIEHRLNKSEYTGKYRKSA